jgi:nitroimidazol reductase NimA-like FMN-containing flavoprotein (pyridoxamine 5'-phosphate oxidase superfamily)
MALRHELEILGQDQCLDLLRTVRVGRLVFTEQALPAVQPVNFRVWQGDIVIRVGSGAKLAAAVGNLVVAFETDELIPTCVPGAASPSSGMRSGSPTSAIWWELSGLFLQPS